MTSFATGSVISKDGTTIGYRQIGQGPALILLHGGMQAAQHLTRLAEDLSDSFAVYIPDRRGRGLSGPANETSSSLEKECEDVYALLLKSCAHYVFGLSSGGAIALQSALRFSVIQKVAVYEPPLPGYGPSPTRWIARYNQEIQEGNLGAALVTVLKGVGLFPWMKYTPRFLLVPLMKWGLQRSERNVEGDIPIKELIPTMRFDVQLVSETENTLSSLAQLKADALLLGGSKAPVYLQQTLDILERTLPHARRVRLPNLDHLGPSNEGNPALVAAELRRFLAEPPLA